MRSLRKDARVETRFILRDNFFAGVADHSPDAQDRVRKAYLQNLVESDYVLCARGGGNYSYRFYETLAAGRIPLLLDTNCVLPFDFAIDYDEHAVVVDADRVSGVADALDGFHSKLSSEEFLNLQARCRCLWDEYLSPAGFFAHLHLCLERFES